MHEYLEIMGVVLTFILVIGGAYFLMEFTVHLYSGAAASKELLRQSNSKKKANKGKEFFNV